MDNYIMDLPSLDELVKKIDATYDDGVGVNFSDGEDLPRRSEVVAVTEKLLELIFPGYDNRKRRRNSTAALLLEILNDLAWQIRRAMRRVKKSACHSGNCQFDCKCSQDHGNCESLARQVLEAIPEIRNIVKMDVAAAYAGDPAAANYDEIILSYPGLKAITIQRLAHVLYLAKVPLLPRMMTEHAHSLTGIDIHPGAQLGRGIFIDHGTGVVIGETARLGDGVRIYQGVTLGAVSFPKDACGMLVKGTKRHPTIGNNVTIYSGASVLGDITIGDNSVIGGNVWLTESLPPGTKITSRMPELSRRNLGEKK